MRNVLISLIVLIAGIGSFISWRLSQAESGGKKPFSAWVYPGDNGKLVYKITENGDRIMDFSFAGYMGGGVALPEPPVRITIKPSGRPDDTKAILAAIDEVSAMPLIDGFRGAVLLAAGTFVCSETIRINASGVVLRGSGSGEGGTTIRMTGDRHAAFIIGERSGNTPAEASETETKIADAYVPSGASSFRVADPEGFRAGDRIRIQRTVTDKWLEFMEMHNLVRDGKRQRWLGGGNSLVEERQIVAISGNEFLLNRPVTDSYDAKYLDPPGTLVTRITSVPVVVQVGVERLHVQCPPLEIAYSQAPYSGIRIYGDDCWVRDVYFEETMNTATLEGNRITMQEVKVKHTYPNLGASKPADFSFQGSCNLLDRCHATGGNTYFVWTGSRVFGPNVVLNSTFSGHGSRIQPHHRWSTGMLLDNCVIPDGGIDFPNRGAAGSGHGWTMGWAVAWNCTAKSYVIQNPPGVMNWAIGCVGRRDTTARYFDTAPVQPEGVFDSHGQPVAPQSLYLAQLLERKGLQALKNIGYAGNSREMFRTVEPLPPLPVEKDEEFGENLALHRPLNASNIRGKTREFSGERAVDGNPETYWATDDSVLTATLELDTEGPLVINAVGLGEFTKLGPRIEEYKVEGQVDSDWKLLAEGTTIGERKIDTFPDVTVWKVRLTIKGTKYPAVRRFGLYCR